jgi:hypothetical protein
VGIGTSSENKSGLPSLLRVLSPLLFLFIPLVIYILATYLIADYSEKAAFWTQITAYVLSGCVVCWVLVRFVFYLRLLFAVRRQHAEMQRHDPLFIVGMKMADRLKKVHEKLKQSGVGVYDVPFHVVVSDPDAEVDAFLSGSGIAFPKELNDFALDPSEDFERWYVGTEAVFVDVSRLMSPSMQNEWLVFLKTLASGRWNAPVNGAVVVFSREHFMNGELQQQKDLELAIQKNLQLMQEKLKEKFPAYMVAMHVDEIEGFQDFFGDLKASARAQMFGWSNLDPLATPLDLARFNVGLNQILSRMKNYLLSRMAILQDTGSVDRAYLFVGEIQRLNAAVKNSVSRIFNPQNYLDPVPFRGIYYTGGGYTGSGGNTIGASATFMGDGTSLNLSNKTMVGVGKNVHDSMRNQNWFAGDFVSSKLLSESGNIARPLWVLKKQRRILGVGIAALITQLVLSIVFMISEVMATSDWRKESERVLAEANEILKRPFSDVPNPADIADAENILSEISRLETILKDESLFQGSSSLGRRGELLSGLETIHDAIFYRYFVRTLIREVETELSSWQPGNKPFQEIGAKLLEYIKWANPHYDGPLVISPFLSKSETVEMIKRRQFLEQHFSYDENGEKPVLVDKLAAQRIIKIYKQINGPDRVTLPLQPGEKYRSPGESEWEWWSRVSGAINNILTHINETIAVQPDQTERFRGDPGNQIFDLVQAVNKLMAEVDELTVLAKEGQDKFPFWVSSIDEFFKRSKGAAANWHDVEEAITKSQGRDEYAVGKIVVPIFDTRMHLIQLFNELSSGQLRAFLLGFAEKRAGISSREAKIYQDIGSRVMRLHRSFGTYLRDFQKLIEKQGQLVSTSDYFQPDDILKNLLTMRKEAESVSSTEDELLKLLAATDQLAQNENEAELSMPDNPKDAKKAKPTMKQGVAIAKSAMGDEVIRKAVFEKYNWQKTSNWVRAWQKVVKKERIYLLSMHWMELFDWYRPIPKSNHTRSWHELMRLGPLAEGGDGEFTEKIDDFLEQWTTSIPSEVVAVIKDESQPQPKEIRNFNDLYGQVNKFRTTYMPGLRKATKTFATTVKALNSNAYENWKKLSESSDSELSWDALESYSRFRDEYEIAEGKNVLNITGSLIGLETRIRKQMAGQLNSDFSARWKSVLREIDKYSLSNAFPFNRGGRSGNHNEVLEILAIVRTLGEQYGIVAQDAQSNSAELSPEAKSALDGIVSASRRTFIKRCVAFQHFLKGDDNQLPHAMIRIASKEIGRHYHWIRMTIRRNAYFDMSVYGEKAERVDITSNYGDVKFDGLDINKVSGGQTKVAKGDLGLLMFLYNHGKPTDPDRTRWIVTSQLAASDADGKQVGFDLEFVFNQPVPQLPVIP